MQEKFDKTAEFASEIEPKILELQDLCLKYKIPFFAVFGVKQNTETDLDKTIYSNVVKEDKKSKPHPQSIVENTEKAYCLMPQLFSELETSDKVFGRLVAVMNGAQTRPANSFEGFSGVQGNEFDSFNDSMPDKL